MIITYANVFLFVLMSKKSVITLFEKKSVITQVDTVQS